MFSLILTGCYKSVSCVFVKSLVRVVKNTLSIGEEKYGIRAWQMTWADYTEYKNVSDNTYIVTLNVLSKTVKQEPDCIHCSPLMEHLQQPRDKSTFYFWAQTVATCFQPPASPTQTLTGLMSGRSGFLEAVLQVNKFWAICFRTAPFHHQVPPLPHFPSPPLPTPFFLDIHLINFLLCFSLCPHPKRGKRGLGGKRQICSTWCFEAK